MSIKNITVIDIALVELLDGPTPAPGDVLQRLEAKGHVTLAAGKPALTPKGRRRAERLKPLEHDLRLMFAGSKDKAAITTDGAAGLHTAGGRATICF